MKYSDIEDISKIRVTGARLLIVKEKSSKKDFDKTDSGLYIPADSEATEDKGNIAEVICGGPAVEINVIKGDFVMYDKYAGFAFAWHDNEYIILSESDVMAIL